MPRTTPTPSLERLTYTVDEAAAAMGVSDRHVRRAIWTGQLRALRAGRRVLIPAQAIGEYLGSLAQAAQ
jgi:excisionase family DNA binding protein